MYTTLYASENGIWPRPAPTPAPAPTGGGTGGGAPTPGVTPRPPAPTPPALPETGVVQAEDVLKAALTQVFEKARSKGATTLDSMNIRPFDKSDALKLIPLGDCRT